MKFLEIVESDLLIDSDGIQLTAKLSLASPEAPLVVFVHGFAGDMNEGGLFREASAFFQEQGFSTLRFDFRGCGDSSDFPFRQIRLKDLQVDLKNVFRFVHSQKEFRPRAIGVIGFSLGAALSILCNPPGIKAHVYWSPAIFTANDMYPRYQTREIQREIKNKGFFLKAGLEVGPEFIDDLLQNQIDFYIRNVKAQVLLVHGGLDARIPASSSRQASKLFKHAKLCYIPHADHAFRRQGEGIRHLLFSASLDWFKKHLPKDRPEISNNRPQYSGDLFDNLYV